MAAEAGHAPSRVYTGQDGNLHLNGAKVFDASEIDITSTVGGTAVAAVAGTAEASKVPLLGTSKNLDVLTVALATLTAANGGVGASTAAAGTTTADAGALPAGTGLIYPTTAADDTKGVVINAADKVTGRILVIGNGVSNKILKIYAPSGGAINGAAADAAFSTGSGKSALIVCLSGSGNTWFALG